MREEASKYVSTLGICRSTLGGRGKWGGIDGDTECEKKGSEVRATRGEQVLEIEEEKEEKEWGIDGELGGDGEMRGKGIDRRTDKKEEKEIDWEREDDKFLNGKESSLKITWREIYTLPEWMSRHK